MTDLARLYRTGTEALDAGHALLVLANLDGVLEPRGACSPKTGVTRAVRDALRMLAATSRVQVGILSGRSLDDVRARVGVPGVIYAGWHGAHIDGSGMTVDRATRVDRDVCETARGQAAMRSVRRPDVVDLVVAQASCRTQCVRDIRARVCSNAAAVMTIYVGGHASDDLVFRSLEGEAVTVGVGPGIRNGTATYWLDEPRDVNRFLALLAEDIGADVPLPS